MQQQSTFLRYVWNVLLFDYRTTEIPTAWLWGFVPTDLLYRADTEITLDTAISFCQSENVIEESFDLTVEKLKGDWMLLKPEAKVTLIHVIKEHNLEHQFEGMLQLTFEEEQALRIRWDVADVLYSEMKTKAFEECRTVGLDLEPYILARSGGSERESGTKAWHTGFRMWLPSRLEEVTQIALRLMRSKLEVDLAVILIEQPNNLNKYATRIIGRLKSEYLRWVVSIRESVSDNSDYWTESGQRLSREEVSSPEVLRIVQERLRSFIEDLETLSSRIDLVKPTADIYSRVIELIGHNREVNVYPQAVHLEVREMTQEKVINIGAGATITAPVVIAETIENAFNAVAKSAVGEELKGILQQLIKEVNEVGKSIDSDDAVSMANDTESLSKELTRPRPRLNTAKRIIEDIKDATVATGEIAGSVLTTIARLSPVLEKLA